MTRALALVAALVLTLGIAVAGAGVPEARRRRSNGRVVDVTWRQQPIRYFVTERDGTGVTAADLRGAVGARRPRPGRACRPPPCGSSSRA